MESDKKEAVKRAAIYVTRNANTQVTEVIEREGPLGLSDRVAAAAAALILCSPCYFLAWFLLSILLDQGSGLIFGLVQWTWRLPVYATIITTVGAFLIPGATYRIFGKAMKPIFYLIAAASGG